MDALRAAYPEHNVYGSPPGKVELPAIVIAPDTPYYLQKTFCLSEWAYQVGFVVGRTSDNQDLDQLDELIPGAFTTLADVPGAQVQQCRSIDAMEIGGTPYVAAVFAVKLKGS